MYVDKNESMELNCEVNNLISLRVDLKIHTTTGCFIVIDITGLYLLMKTNKALLQTS